MTTFEKNQPKSTFIRAGRNAFLIDVRSENNPYPLEPFRSHWAEGWKLAKRSYNQKRYSRPRAVKANHEETRTTPHATRNVGALLRRGLANGPFRRDERQQRSRPANRPQRQGNAAGNIAAIKRQSNF